MKTLWILAAAATFAACHNRSSDETGAAPDRGDTTAVQSGYDTTSKRGAVKTDSAMTPSADPSPTAAPAPTPAPRPARAARARTAAAPGGSGSGSHDSVAARTAPADAGAVSY